MKKNGIEVFKGHGKFRDSKTLDLFDAEGKQGETLLASHFLIATGARSRSIPSLPVDGKGVLSYREAIVQKTQPSSVLVVGAGAIGCEFSYVWSSFGSKVTLVEMASKILPPEDDESSLVLEKEFKKQKIEVLTACGVEGVEYTKEDQVKVTLKNSSGEILEKTVDQVLVSAGVVPNTEELNLDHAGVSLNERGFIQVNDHYQTSVSHIFSIGDVTGPPMLAHKASLEGILCVEHLFDKPQSKLDLDLIPKATYCQPQVASVGLTEKQAKEKGLEFRVGKFPFSASGKARAIGHTVGHVKVIIDKKHGEILGTHICGLGCHGDDC